MSRPHRYDGRDRSLTITDYRITPEPNTGCWLWMGDVMQGGYGRTKFQGRRWLVHRAVWHNLNGPIPEGMHLDHICRVRSCCNPDHLRVVTPGQNVLENSLSLQAANAAKTCCSACGGAYTVRQEERDGKRRIHRVCLPCYNKWHRAWRRRNPRLR